MATEDSTVEYRSVADFPGYRVGDDGSVWTCWRTCRAGSRMTSEWKRLKPGVQPRGGYLYVNLSRDGKYLSNRVHKIVLTAFAGPCPEGMECRHLNGSKTDNRLENLKWGTQKENRGDCYKHDTYEKGQDHSQAKLIDEQVREIRARYAAGGVLQRTLAEEFGVNSSTVSHITNRKTWKHID